MARIWKAIQGLDGAAPELATATQEAATPAPRAPKGAPKKAKATKTAKAKHAAPEAREGSKKSIVLDLLRRKGGATLAEIAKATDWQNHSNRGSSAEHSARKWASRSSPARTTRVAESRSAAGDWPAP